MAGQNRNLKKPSDTKAEALLRSSIFYVDECLGKKICEILRAEGLRIESSADHFPSDTEDVVWIPKVAAKGWISLTKDKNIKRNVLERRAVMISKARLFTLRNGGMKGDQMADLFKLNLKKMGRIINKNQAPFIGRVSAEGIELLGLDDLNY